MGASLGNRSGGEAGRGAIVLLAALWILAAAGRSASDESAAEPAPSTVVLISLDGARPADLTQARLPSLLAVGRAGGLAEALVPVDPTNTFPNHVSLATGVRPDVHRLVNNTFVDPERGLFRRQRPHEWIESEPIWSVAERHGVPAASYYWVGSEGDWSRGPGPSESRVFSSRTSERTKVDQILAWLGQNDLARRPRLITAWFHGPDHAAHDHGPDSAEVSASLVPQDQAIGRLVRVMEERGLFLTTTLLFVSDHGMVQAERRVNLGARLREAGLHPRVLGIGGFASVVLGASRTPATLARTLWVAREAGLAAWPPAEAPEEWHVDDPRFGDVVVRAPLGTAIVSRTGALEGFHGYAAEEPPMAGILVARGRGVAPGTHLGRVSNLSIAPTVLRLLELPVPPQMRGPLIEGLLVGVEAEASKEER